MIVYWPAVYAGHFFTYCIRRVFGINPFFL